MGTNVVDNKRIAKNTIILYIRTLFVMFVSLFTSRIILEELGVENYGISNVVGGLVGMFSVISASLTSASSRFITFEIGRGDKGALRKTFSTSIIIQASLAIIVFVVCELIGTWFLETQMQIPQGRMYAAKWVLQFSIISFCIGLITIPFGACIIAHERMSIYAYLSIFNSLMNLAICYLLTISPIDRLIFYSILGFLVNQTTTIINIVYCKRNFDESRGKITFDKEIFKKMVGFSGWSFYNNTTYILNNQGINMLINIFFGVAVNAARGIATQVENAVHQFVNNFTIAINPQITKSYASGDLESMHQLVCRGAKFSYFIMLIMALPIIIEAEQILNIWLINVPQYTIIFTQLALVMGMCDCIGSSGYTACIATGNLKRYSIIITSIGIMEFPIAWLFFAMGALPEYAYYTYIAVKITVLIVRMFLLESMVGLKVSMYSREVFVPIILTTTVAIIIPTLLSNYMEQTILRLFAVAAVSIISVSLCALYIGMTKNERCVIISKAKNLTLKFKHRIKP
ncbi:MAG: lipopolysaccharide biosynthesis protein [Muribaculaceae bacterium]|nr:lipopolysaccharide biosynthesis protein [Muribaculaceae bacterium]